MIDFATATPLETSDERYVILAKHTGDFIGIRETLNACAGIPPLNDMEYATALDVSDTVSERHKGREQYRIVCLVQLGRLIEIERQRHAAETDDGAADVPVLTEHPAAGLSDDTRLKAANEKLDAVLDVLNVITGAVAPDAAFSMRTFADGSGRFLPVDTPADTGKGGTAHADTPTTDA